MSWLLELDGNILLWIQEYMRNDFLTPIWKAITSLGNKGWFWIVLSLVLCIPKKTRVAGITGLLALIIGVLITNVCLKNVVARIRPYEAVDGLQRLIRRQKDFSFPSGHSCASFAAAAAYYRTLPGALAGNGKEDRKHCEKADRYEMRGKICGIAALALAALIAFSRLYVGVHYPSDVLAGILIGCFSAWAANRIVQLKL
ncbi:MAG: phosphatase PAP2 family protein [Hespellia sp.]|nr:phosphatase PAP2 family protein [Hespellia sp.]